MTTLATINAELRRHGPGTANDLSHRTGIPTAEILGVSASLTVVDYRHQPGCPHALNNQECGCAPARVFG
jgi:hypothetical protein